MRDLLHYGVSVPAPVPAACEWSPLNGATLRGAASAAAQHQWVVRPPAEGMAPGRGPDNLMIDRALGKR